MDGLAMAFLISHAATDDIPKKGVTLATLEGQLPEV